MFNTFIRKLESMVFLWILGEISLMNAGKFETEAGLAEGSEAAKFYYAQKKGKLATSVDDPLLQAVVRYFDDYNALPKEALAQFEKSGSPEERLIIKHLILQKKEAKSEEDKIKELLNEVRKLEDDFRRFEMQKKQQEANKIKTRITTLKAQIDKLQNEEKMKESKRKEAEVKIIEKIRKKQEEDKQQRLLKIREMALQKESIFASIKIDIVDKNKVELTYNSKNVGTFTKNSSGSWIKKDISQDVTEIEALQNADELKFTLGSLKFIVNTNGNVLINGGSPMLHCCLECPKQGNLLLGEVSVDRFVCLNRGKTINVGGPLTINDVWFCFEQKIISTGDIVKGPNGKGAILMLQCKEDEFVINGDLGVDLFTWQKDTPCDKFGCHCLYGFDRVFCGYSAYDYPNYPDDDSNVFVNADSGNFFYMRKDRVRVPFDGHTSELDYKIDIEGEAVVAFVGNGNYVYPSCLPEIEYKFDLYASSGKIPFASGIGIAEAGKKACPLNIIFKCTLPACKIKIYIETTLKKENVKKWEELETQLTAKQGELEILQGDLKAKEEALKKIPQNPTKYFDALSSVWIAKDENKPARNKAQAELGKIKAEVVAKEAEIADLQKKIATLQGQVPQVEVVDLGAAIFEGNEVPAMYFFKL